MWPFISEVVQRTTELDVDLYLAQSDHVLYMGQECSGFFTHVPNQNGRPLLASHLEGETAEATLYHEFNHMEQWHENCKAWRECLVTDLIGTEDLICLWMENEIELSRAQLKDYTQRSVNVELDCERRTVRLIRRLRKEGKTTIDPKVFTQKANAYVMLWWMVAKTRAWYTIGKRPFELPEVYSEFPTTFSLDYTKLPRKYEKLYAEFCY